MKKLYILLILAFLTSIGFSQRKEYYFSVIEKDKNLINTIITQTVSIDKVMGETVYCYANPKQLAKFKSLGYQINELPHPSSLSKVSMATTVAQMANWNLYPTYSVYRQMMKNFEINYPGLCKLDSIGTSVEGRKLYMLKISDNIATTENEPEVFYTSSIHGDEVTGFVLTLRLADYLLSNYGSNSRITNMVNNLVIYINPASNPDGTYSPSDNDINSATRSNANGVDMNRNYPDPRVGQHPDGEAWQPETQAFMAFAGQHHFVMSANFHGGIELANYPWDAWTSAQNPHADNDWWAIISRNYADSCHAFGPSGYFTGENNGVTHGGDWYVVAGGRQDYMNYWHHCREITLEISDTKMISNTQLPAMWTANRAAMLTYLERALYGFNGTVSNPSGNGIAATIFIVGHDKDHSEVLSNPQFGNYYRPIKPGTYQVTYSAEGYISQNISVTVANYYSTTIQNVVLQPAQQVTISGIVTAVDGGATIEGVKIELLGTSFNPVFTNSSGQYSMPGVFENTYQIKISKAGYAAITQNINVSTSSTNFNFQLNESLAESFEAGIPAGFTMSTIAWSIDNSTSYDGSASLKSGAIGNNANTSVSIQLNILSAGNIAFYKKVSSESGYDKLKFYIDGTEKGNWSGSVEWSEATYSVTTGSHTFKWEYSKDGSSTGGSDCAWIDQINFPLFGVNVTFHVTNPDNDALEGVQVVFNNQTQNTASNGNVTFNNVPRGNAKPYTASLAGYLAAEGTVNTYYQNLTQNIQMVSSSGSFDITFHVSHGSNPVQNAQVNFNGLNLSTDAQGNVLFISVPAGNNVAYSVNANGYELVNGSVNVNSNKTVNVSLTALPVYYTVTFIVSDGITSVDDAVITLNSVTNPIGDYIFENMPVGTFNYAVVAEGFFPITGSVTVTNDDLTEPVAMVHANMITFNLDMTNVSGFNPASDHIYISGTLNNWMAPGSAQYELAAGENMVYSLSLPLLAGDYEYKFYKNSGWNNPEWIGTPNRAIHVYGDKTLHLTWGIINGISQNTNQMLYVYPNPFENYLVVKSDELIREIKVYEVLGKEVYSSTPNSNLLEINMENFEKGIYFIDAKSSGHSRSFKVIKQ